MRARRLFLLALALVACLECTLLAAPLADLAGFWAPRTYLVLAQNEDELRPTGTLTIRAMLFKFLPLSRRQTRRPRRKILPISLPSASSQSS